MSFLWNYSTTLSIDYSPCGHNHRQYTYFSADSQCALGIHRAACLSCAPRVCVVCVCPHRSSLLTSSVHVVRWWYTWLYDSMTTWLYDWLYDLVYMSYVVCGLAVYVDQLTLNHHQFTTCRTLIKLRHIHCTLFCGFAVYMSYVDDLCDYMIVYMIIWLYVWLYTWLYDDVYDLWIRNGHTVRWLYMYMHTCTHTYIQLYDYMTTWQFDWLYDSYMWNHVCMWLYDYIYDYMIICMNIWIYDYIYDYILIWLYEYIYDYKTRWLHDWLYDSYMRNHVYIWLYDYIYSYMYEYMTTRLHIWLYDYMSIYMIIRLDDYMTGWLYDWLHNSQTICWNSRTCTQIKSHIYLISQHIIWVHDYMTD